MWLNNIDSSIFCFQLKLFFFSIFLFNYPRWQICFDGVTVQQTWRSQHEVVKVERSNLGCRHITHQPWWPILQCWDEGQFCFFIFLISNIYGVILREVWRLILYSTRENHSCVHQGQCWRKIWFFFNHHAVKCLIYRNNASHSSFQQKLFFFAYTCTKCSMTYSV